MDLLSFLAGWYGGWQQAGRADVQTRFGRSVPAADPQSAWIDVKGPTRWGQICVWETGTVDLEVNDIVTIDLVFSLHRDAVESPEELEELLALLLAEVAIEAP